MQKIISLLFLSVFLSCSNLSKNVVKDGDLRIKNGRLGEKVWSESLNMTRRSWYHELTLVFDLAYTRLGKDSAFLNWFSDFEKNEMSFCKDFIVVMTYSLDSKKISNAMFTEQVKFYGYEKMALPGFTTNLRLHPEYEALSLGLYDAFGLCLKTDEKKNIILRFPGFTDVTID